MLIRMAQRGDTCQQIAKALKRTRQSVYAKMRSLGIEITVLIHDAKNIYEAARLAHERNFVNWDWCPKLKPTPVKFPPGSWEKVEVLRWRLENGMELWHEDDAKLRRIDT